MTINYYDKQRASARLAEALTDAGWKVLGYKEDKSDSMTDYYAPAYCNGVAINDKYQGCVVVIFQYSNADSGKPEMKSRYKQGDTCPHCNGTGSEPTMTEWTLTKAQANPQTFHTANDKAYHEYNGSLGVSMLRSVVSPLWFNERTGECKCYECHGSGHKLEHEQYAAWTWPTFQANPKGYIWHVEKNGKIIAKGKGVDNMCGYREDEYGPAVAQAVAQITAACEPKPSQPAAAAEPTTASIGAFETINTTHTKTGEPIYIAKLTTKVERAEFDRVSQQARSHGGYYSRFVSGFIFPSQEARAQFVSA